MNREQLAERINSFARLGAINDGVSVDIPPKAIENALKFLSWIDDESIPFICVYTIHDGSGINFESFDTDFSFNANVTSDYIEQLVYNDKENCDIGVKIPIGARP